MAREIGLESGGAAADFAGVYHADGAGSVVVPHGALILTGSYERAGPDLVIAASGGEKVLVTGFFAGETPPDLLTMGGARIAGELAERLAGPLAPGQVAQAGTAPGAAAIGTVENVAGTVTATRADGSQVQLSQGSPVYQGDVIQSGPGAAVGIRFIDETVFAMEESGRMVLDELIYDPASRSGSAGFSLVQGVFSFATGQIAKTDPSQLLVRTPVAMIGVRGTDVGVELNQVGEESTIVCREGAILVSNDGGSQLVLQGQQVRLASFDQAPSDAEVVSLGTIDLQFQRALQFRPQQRLDDDGRRGDFEDDERRDDAFAGVSPEQLGEIAPAAGEGPLGTGPLGLVAEAVLQPVDLGTQLVLDSDPTGLGGRDGGGRGGDRNDDIIIQERNGDAGIIVFGTAGDDILFGSDGDDEIYGGAGDDVIMSSPGNDSLFGGDGIDTVDYSNAGAGIVADLGAGQVSGAATGNDQLDSIENLVGSGFADQIMGADGNNTLLGGGGNDTIGAGAGDDVVDGGEGDDSLIGGSGEGDDLFIGGEGRDIISYTSATAGIVVNLTTGIVDGVAGGVGTDTLIGIEDVRGSNFADLIIGDAGPNLLLGEAGDDTLVGGGSNDTLDGGAGTDLASYATAEGPVSVNLAAGIATGADGADVLIDIENVDGSGFADTLIGDGGDNLLRGGAGNDSLVGGGGNDTLVGGPGDDTLDGGAGDDLLDGTEGANALFGGAGNDTLMVGEDATAQQLFGGAGIDRLETTGDLRLAGFNPGNGIEIVAANGAIRGTAAANLLNFSAVTLLGVGLIQALGGDDTVIGSAAADLIEGGEGNDSLVGGGGDDTLAGGAGDDTLAGGAGNDLLIGTEGANALFGGAGDDTLQVAMDATAQQLFGGAGNDVLSTAGDLRLSGFGAANSIETVSLAGQLLGTGAADLLDFSASTLVGASGIFGLEGDDTIVGTAAGDLIEGGAGNDSLVGGAGNDTLFGGPGDDTLEGGVGDDLLDGGTGTNALFGGAGNDTLIASSESASHYDGGAGVDRLLAVGALRLSNFGADNSVEFIEAAGPILGTDGNDRIDLSATALIGVTDIRGGAGSDTLVGSAAHDLISGGTGDDLLIGGAGNDSLFGDEVTTSVVRVDATAGTLGNLTAANFDQFWGDLLVTGATTSGTGLSPLLQSNVSIDPRGLGVAGTTGQAGQTEINFDLTNDSSEVLRIDFGREVFDVTVTVDQLFAPELGLFEQGEWVALSNGVEVGRSTFTNQIGTGSGQLTFGLDVSGSLDTLLFTATPYVDAAGNPQFPVGNDSSDYVVRQITYSYDEVVYADGGGGGADLLIGGPGADLMRGGAGADVFRYAGPDDGTAIATNTYVEHTGLAVDRILDFVSGEDRISFDPAAFDPLAQFVALSGERYDGSNSGFGSGSAFVFDGKYLIYDEDVGQEGYTAIAEVRGDAPVATDIQVG